MNERINNGSRLSEELHSYCNSDSLSEEGIREIIERHGFTQNQNNSHHGDVGNYQFFFKTCRNRRVTEEIIRFLLECFPAAIRATDVDGGSSLHYACSNPNVTPKIIQLLIDAAPDSVRSVNNIGAIPLHYLCRNEELDERAALTILKLLVEKHPEAVRHANNGGILPIHIAAITSKPPEFCRELIKAYPGSERISGVIGGLPLHYASSYNTVATVEYFYKLYPDAINHATAQGIYPIHEAILGLRHRESPITAVEIVKFLLVCDSKMAPLEVAGVSLLYLACRQEYNDSSIQAGIQMIKVIYDAHPEAIEHRRISSDIQRYHQQVRAFINSQLVHARQGDFDLITRFMHP